MQNMGGQTKSIMVFSEVAYVSAMFTEKFHLATNPIHST